LTLLITYHGVNHNDHVHKIDNKSDYL
jgi:hypothetical protein